MCEEFDMELLTVDEASKVLRLKPSTVRSWLLKRRIPFVKLGSRVFIRKEDCLKLIQTNMVRPSIEKKHGNRTTLHSKIVLYLNGEFQSISGDVRDSVFC